MVWVSTEMGEEDSNTTVSLWPVDQTTDVVLYSADKYTKAILTEEFG